MIIYKTTNLINNKIYIGKDKHNNPKYLGSGLKIRLAVKKYGKNNFSKEILEFCGNEVELNEREIYWIKKFNSIDRDLGYNITNGGEGGDTISNNPRKSEIGAKHSENMKTFHIKNPKSRKEYIKKKDNPDWVNPNKGKKRIGEKRISNKRGIPNPKHSEWMKKHNPFKGKTHSLEEIEKIRERGRQPKSNDHKKRISESLMGNKPGNMRKVSVDGIEYESLTDGARKNGIPISTMKNRLKSKNKKFEKYQYVQGPDSQEPKNATQDGHQKGHNYPF